MLKFATIFSLIVIILSFGYNLRDMLKAHSFGERLVNFIALLITAPMLYVFIKVLQML